MQHVHGWPEYLSQSVHLNHGHHLVRPVTHLYKQFLLQDGIQAKKVMISRSLTGHFAVRKTFNQKNMGMN